MTMESPAKNVRRYGEILSEQSAKAERMFSRFEPIDDCETVEREMERHDGMIRVRMRPFHQRFWRSYKGFRCGNMSVIAALRGAWFMASI
jgi:hypothetical protein